jgi:hypothetical protein
MFKKSSLPRIFTGTLDWASLAVVVESMAVIGVILVSRHVFKVH